VFSPLTCRKSGKTNLFGRVFDESVPTGLALLRTGLVEEVVEFCDLAVLCADLHEEVSVGGGEVSGNNTGREGEEMYSSTVVLRFPT
jgi:hypothetical protein